MRLITFKNRLESTRNLDFKNNKNENNNKLNKLKELELLKKLKMLKLKKLDSSINVISKMANKELQDHMVEKLKKVLNNKSFNEADMETIYNNIFDKEYFEQKDETIEKELKQTAAEDIEENEENDDSKGVEMENEWF